jgi:hypothetical protein
LFVDASGNVGIGASPSSLLWVRGGAATATISSSTNTSNLDITNNTQTTRLGAINADFSIAHAGSERLRITSTGLVGIGVSAPSYQLDLGGGTTVNTRIQIARGSDDSNAMRIGYNTIDLYRNVSLESAQTGLAINQVGSDGTRNVFQIDSSGRCGIGTTTVNNGVLHVKSNGIGSQAGLAVEASANDSFLSITNNGSAHKLEASYNSTGSYQPISFVINGEKARIDTSGRLLVGTSSASAMDSSSQFGSATPRQTIFENTATGGAAFVNVQGEMNGSAATRIAGINFALSTQTTITESAKSASLYVTATDAFANTPSLFIAVGNDNAISIPTSGIANFIKGLTIPTGKAIGGAGIINMSGSSGHELNNIASSLCLTTDSAADGSIIVFDRSGVGQGSISVTTGTVSYNQFLGSHWAALTDWSRPNIKLGTILETINELTDWKYVAIEVEGKQKKICYNGTAAPDDMVSVEYEGKTYEGIVELEDNSKFNKAVKVKVNDTAASKAVYGVFVGWNTDGNFDGGIWNDMYVGAVGNYVIRMAAGQEPEIGDLVEADGTGCAVVQADDIIRTKTVAKITSTIPQVAYDDGSFIVTCVLYCG